MPGLVSYAASPSPSPPASPSARPSTPGSSKGEASQPPDPHHVSSPLPFPLKNLRFELIVPVPGPSIASKSVDVPHGVRVKSKQADKIRARSTPMKPETAVPAVEPARKRSSPTRADFTGPVDIPHDGHDRFRKAARHGTKHNHASTTPAPHPPPRPSIDTDDATENLTHTAQSQLAQSVLSHEPVSIAEDAGETAGWPGYVGMTDDEVFRVVSRPPGSRERGGSQSSGQGLGGARTEEGQWGDDLGLPPAVDPAECSETLESKVSHFLRLKYERNEHINTRLLSSSTFANPHIYSKLVDFVQINEHQSAFPHSGWLTRLDLEAEIPLFGPASLSAQQKAKQEATRRAQEIGKRKEIAFQPSRAIRDEQTRRTGGDRSRGGSGTDSGSRDSTDRHAGDRNGSSGAAGREQRERGAREGYARDRGRNRDRGDGRDGARDGAKYRYGSGMRDEYGGRGPHYGTGE